ncbi:pseudouridine synthase [Lentibacillus sp. Marseille-P4043]|uniref:pseudouridine synthase n=1 Tax=Lentibacillus sp. Marseille-P4043 TaxID=2040293 RepID=UPI000D0AC0A4|nr:pseudouridine synthase [Lentibacillus sp. Marseille-P4043]
MRLDKLLANTGFGSRKDVKGLLKKKQVTVNDLVQKDGSVHVDPAKDIIIVNGKSVQYQKYLYIMLHKPQGCISATVDDKERTVVDLLSESHQHFNPFPVGRLDKDTEGLLLLTNDGELAHQLTSPKKKIKKTYAARVSGLVTDEDIVLFKRGIVLEDGYKTKPAELIILQAGDISEIELTITEGKYHQVKRMFEAVGKKVTYLKRLSMGELQLDGTLIKGEYRELTEEELSYCLSLKKEKS